MSGRRRRCETLWDDYDKGEKLSARSRKWSKSHVHDDFMHGNFPPRSPSWDSLQGGLGDDDISRDRTKMRSHPTLDDYSTCPRDNTYGLPYNYRSSERERSWSSNGSRSRSRDGGSTRACRHESNASYDMRNNSDSRTGTWSHRTDYKDGSRYPHQNTRTPCRYFASGNCNRDHCKFAHVENNNNSTTWDTEKLLDSSPNFVDNKKSSWTSWDDLEEPAKQSLDDDNSKGKMKIEERKKWDGPLWDEPETDNNPKITCANDSDLNNNNNSSTTAWVTKKSLDSSPNFVDNKKSCWTSWDDLEEPVKQSLDDDNSKGKMKIEERKKWDGPLWDEPETNNNPKITRAIDSDSGLNNNHKNHMVVVMSEDGNLHTSGNGNETSPQRRLLSTELRLTDAIDFLRSLPKSAFNQDTRVKKEEPCVEVQSQNHDSSKMEDEGEIDKKEEELNINSEPQGKAEEEGGGDQKAIRQFKVGLVEFVKEILKPKWKEGKMSREVHKSVVKKVAEKVTSTIQRSQVPTTQPKIDQYLAFSKPKITKLVEAYMERLLKAEKCVA